MELALVVATIAIALGFGYTNGFHDAANSIATSVSTRALTPRIAVLMAATMNFLGAFMGQQVAQTVTDIIDVPSGLSGLVVIIGALVGAISWNLITWWYGLPSSSSQALIGGLVGAGLVAGITVNWDAVTTKVLLPMLISPVVGFALAYLAMLAILWRFRQANPARVNRRFRMLQTVSASAMALGHGLQDAQKTMGVIVLALIAGGYHADDGTIPVWVTVAAATALSAGTYAGGWRIMRTLGRRIIDVDPARGFAAETVSAVILYTTAAFSAPVSTTHTITSAIVGAGATKRLSAVRWGVASNIAVAWVLTIPMAAGLAGVTYLLLNPLLGS